MRSTFDLSHEHKLSCDMGLLVPVACEEVLPGDTFIGSTSLLARIAPQVNPVMHNVDIRVHHWYVPNRILWDEWEDFITAKDDEAVVPTVQASSSAETELMDHMGAYPSQSLTINALPIRAYNKIWNEFYRDQDLSSARDEDALTLARICWEKDYFTVARAQPQQGDAVQIGFSAGEVNVEYRTANGTAGVTRKASDGTAYAATDGLASQAGSGALINQGNTNALFYDPNDTLYADMSTATGGINIDDLRRSIALQRFAEARARFGSRYVDYLKFLGVNPSDGRLDRPEFLGGGKQNVNFSEVLATAEGASTDVGDMFGHGIAGLRSRRYRKMFEEHGWVLSLLSVRPRTAYLEAQPRKFTRSDPMHYWQKELEVLPWQEVPQSEVYALGSASTVFGYVPRYEEYRHGFSYSSGTFRIGTEKDWTMSREFGSAPTLNESFVTCTPTDRIYSDTSMPEVLINAYNSIKARRIVRRMASLGSI